MKIKGEYLPLSGEFPAWEFEFAAGVGWKNVGNGLAVVVDLFALHAARCGCGCSRVVFGDDGQEVYDELRRQLMVEESTPCPLTKTS